MRLRAGLVLCLLAALGCSQGAPAARGGPVANHLRVAVGFRTYHVPTEMGLLTSIVQIASDEYVVGDPGALYRVVRSGSGYVVTRLSKPNVPTWNPQGLAYRDGLVYVANGAGRDVLVLRMVEDSLDLVRRITDPGMASPQDLAVEADGSVVVTDQIGS